MGNVIGSFLSGIGQVISHLFGSPLDFLSGKSCSTVCGSTWDFICYIENFCVAHLLKLAAVSILFYFVLLFFYMLYKLGIYGCVGRTLCKVLWACFATFFSVVEYSCTFLCYKLPMLKRIHRKHKRHIKEFGPSNTYEEEEEEYDDGSFSYHGSRRSQSRRWRDYKREHLRRSLRPRSHRRLQVGIRGDSVHVNKRCPIKYGDHHGRTVHDITVTRTSKFAQKGARYNRSFHRTRRK